MILLLLTSLFMLNATWGQINDSSCPTLTSFHALQQTMIDTTTQLKETLAKHNQQQSSESLTNLVQLALARQLMTYLDIGLPTNNCDCNDTTTMLKQLKAQSDNYREAIHNVTIENEKLKAESMRNRETILNLTISNKKQVDQFSSNAEAIRNLTTDIEQLKAMSALNGKSIRILKGLVDRVVAPSMPSRHHVCGSGGWARVAYLNMTDPLEQCPSGFRLYNQTSTRACGRHVLESGCQASVQFPANGLNYTEVCGRVTGYQYYRTKAFRTSVNGIDQYYLEGVSLTHGFSRKHIWSFAAGYGKKSSFCPCAIFGRSTDIPAFVGNDYFCESGYTGLHRPSQRLYPEPLWDGKGCSGFERACCQTAGRPWFHKSLTAPTNDYIELRICGDSSAEDIPVGYYEIYVK